jgi:hypothetical protein
MQKVWFVKHYGANSLQNIAGYALAETGPGWINVHAVYGFTRRHYAEAWLKQQGIAHYEIIGVELPKSTQDARRSS